MRLTLDNLTAIMGCTRAVGAVYLDGLNNTMERFQINTPKRAAAFLSQVGHESGRLAFVVENLNYSADALLRVFPKYFTKVDAVAYARNPAKIASRVYASRMGNGNEASGDGFRYRGRGLIQITGKSNYSACGKAIGFDLVGTPEYASSPNGACSTAGWFWDSNGLNALADKGDIVGVSKRVNGGTNGLEDRQELYIRALAVLGKA